MEGDNGSKSHAIATVQNCIFDSNCEFAMKLSGNVDWCVSSNNVECKFVSVHWDFVLFHSYPPISLGSCVFEKMSTNQSSLSHLFHLFGCNKLAMDDEAAKKRGEV